MASNESIYSSEHLSSLFQKVVSYSQQNLLNFISPEDLEKDLGQLFSQSQENLSYEAFSSVLDNILTKCVNTSHPHFVNQLYGGVNPIGLVGSYLVEKMNTNQHTFEVAPVFVITERIILKRLRLLFFGSEDGDGIFAPGGSIGNLYGLLMARQSKFPEIKQQGLYGLPPLVIFVSEDAHYSGQKMANVMGLGMDNVIKIKTTKSGSMIPSELEKAIQQCGSSEKVPLMVMATAGTTVLGAFDPLDEIAEVCNREKVWLHLDAAWGGAFIFSEKLRKRYLSGIEKCDSVLWNAHKMLGAPLQCSIFVTRKSNILSECNSVSAPYLFQTNKHYAHEYDDIGDKSFQCGRKADAFKLWLMWIGMGDLGFSKSIEQTEDCARYFTEKIKSLDGFLLYLDEHQCTNVYFWYIPIRLRGQEKTKEWWKEIDEVTTNMKKQLLLQDKLMIGYAPLPHKNIPNAFRLVLTAYPLKSYADMDYIIEVIDSLGKYL